MSSLRPEALTWAGLLAQWVQFAQAALAVPDEGEGSRWRRSVPAIINLQAITFALADLQRLPQEEWPLALDKAEHSIRGSYDQLTQVWLPSTIPPQVVEITADAKQALSAARNNRLTTPH